MNSERVSAIVRLAVMAVLMVNMILTMLGKNPIPFDEAEITEWLTVAAAGISAIWSWWKNNNVTEAAQAAQDTLDALKLGVENTDGGIGDEEATDEETEEVE